VKKLLLHLFILVLVAVWIFPVFWLVVTSLKLEQDVVTRTLTLFNKLPTIRNYIDALSSTRIANWMLNSIVVSLATMAFTVFVDATIAYALARIHFPGRNVVFWVVLSGMMVPFQVLVIPLYLHFNTLGLINTLTAMILPRLALPIGVFILKQFFEGIPHELEEAAVIDGAGRFIQFWRIILPLGKAALVTVLILSFIQAWNDFLWPLIVASETVKYTITVGIANFQGVYGTEYSLIMAGAVIASLPQIIAFLIFREHIVKGIAMTGLKG
jgi:ABC-type glycerol-3-phosphate transport system permease component